MDVGVGMSQVIPVVTAALDRSTGTLAVEQPELHIHPMMQVELGDLFIEQIQTGNKMFIVETHSEHLILRLLRRIRETRQRKLPDKERSLRLQPEQLSITYFWPTMDGVEKTNIDVNEKGRFNDRWPKGFFDERAEELF